MPLIAAVQLTSTSDMARNLDTAEALIRRAAGYGATLVATPEATDYLGPHSQKVRIAEPLGGPTHQRLGALAAELGITLLIGSVAEQFDETRTYNTSLLFGPSGDLLAHYRKLHLFDVDLAAAGGVTFRESDRTAPGESVVVCDTPAAKVGMSICYDVRFAELYRTMADRGAEIMSVPAAFTMMTGKDHWHVLLRARAIENQCWVVAPAQVGRHNSTRESHGETVVIDPWGRVVARKNKGRGLVLADIDLRAVDRVRRGLPCLAHTRRSLI